AEATADGHQEVGEVGARHVFVHGLLVLPPLDDVEAVGIVEVGGEPVVEVAVLLTGGLHRGADGGQGRVTVGGIDGQMTGNDNHGKLLGLDPATVDGRVHP